MRFEVHRSRVIKAWFAAAIMVGLSAVVFGLLETRYGCAHRGAGRKMFSAELPVSVKDWRLVESEPNGPSCNSITGTYRNELNDESVTLCVTCAGSAEEILEHRPHELYEGDGWSREERESVEVVTGQGKSITCGVEHYYRAAGEYQRLVVLSFYVVNGQAVSEEEQFSVGGMFKSLLEKSDTHYIAQVQVISSYESSVVAAASEMAEAIFNMLPGEKQSKD